jgi:hypothetical protein
VGGADKERSAALDVWSGEVKMDLLVPEIVQKATQCHCFHFPNRIWEKHKMEGWPSRIQDSIIWDPLQLNKSGPFLIIRWLPCIITGSQNITFCQKNGTQSERTQNKF